MYVLSPDDRAILWHDAATATDDVRQARIHFLASTTLEAVRSTLDMYSQEYADDLVRTFELIDVVGGLGRDDLRHSFEDIEKDEDSGRSFISALSGYLRSSAEGVADPGLRDELLALSGRWYDVAAGELLTEKLHLSVAEVAALYGVTPQAVYKWIDKDAIRFEKTPGGSFQIPADQFDADRLAVLKKSRELQRRLSADRGAEPPGDSADVVDTIRRRRNESR